MAWVRVNDRPRRYVVPGMTRSRRRAPLALSAVLVLVLATLIGALLAPAADAKIIGTDDRTLVADTTAFPYAAVTKIRSSAGDCSGFLVGVDTVATAAHCVTRKGVALAPSGITVSPGVNCGGRVCTAPFPTCTATKVMVAAQWAGAWAWAANNPKAREADYAALKLDCEVGRQTGVFDLRYRDGDRIGERTYTASYPTDAVQSSMWTSVDRVRTTDRGVLYIGNDIVGGDSGAPVWNATAGCRRCVVAIVSASPRYVGNNVATRITATSYADLMRWRDAPA